jgi:hypothetical protein
MDIEALQSRLHDLGADIPQTTLRRWAYDKREIIPRPKRDKRGTGSGKRGRAAFWSEKAVAEAAAVWALQHSPHITKPTPLYLIPYIKRSANCFYKSPTAGYELPMREKGLTYKSITMNFRYDRYKELEWKQPVHAEWQVLLRTWITTYEKAKRGIPIKEPRQIRFNWRSVDVEEGVNYNPDPLGLVTLAESDHDEIIIMLDGVDFRKQLFILLSRFEFE